MCERNASYLEQAPVTELEALRIRVKKFKQNLPENYSKNTKITTTAVNLKFSGGACPRTDPLRAFLVSELASNLLCRKNTLEENEETIFLLRHCS